MIAPLTEKEYYRLKDLIASSCGIYLESNKQYLIETRLTDLGNEIGAKTFNELHDKIVADRVTLLPRVIDLMTTNETFWFRDDSLWKTLREKVLPEYIHKLISEEKKHINIWSAASSTGQEAYSMSILLRELVQEKGLPHLFNRFSILATDISGAALFLARAARYNRLSIKRGLSKERLEKNFKKEGESYVLDEYISQIVEFKYFNLINSFFPLGPFDIVLCRNVAIYFSQDFKKDLFQRIKGTIYSNGYLFLGATESLFGHSTDFKSMEYENGIFYKPS